jgi:cysteine desulfurase
VTELPVDKGGLLDLAQYEESLTPDTAVVSLMWANNETGVIFPVEQAAAIARERGIPFHTDAVQATGKIPFRMADNAIDMLSFSGHKLHAPKGIGVLYVAGTASPLPDRGTPERGCGAALKTRPASSPGAACDLAPAASRRRTAPSAPSATGSRRPSGPDPRARVHGDPVQRLRTRQHQLRIRGREAILC